MLSGATNAALAIGTATGTILNDDTALRISDVSAREGDSGTTPFVFTISLEKPSALPVTVSYATADGTANAGSDYEAVARYAAQLCAGRDDEERHDRRDRRHGDRSARDLLGAPLGGDRER